MAAFGLVRRNSQALKGRHLRECHAEDRKEGQDKTFHAADSHSGLPLQFNSFGRAHSAPWPLSSAEASRS
jgi:hypothetical protein